VKTFEASSLIERKMQLKDEIDFLFQTKLALYQIASQRKMSNFGNLLKIYISLILNLKKESEFIVFKTTADSFNRTLKDRFYLLLWEGRF